jgi:hypothetical protein
MNKTIQYGVYGLLGNRFVHFTNAEKLPPTVGYGPLVSTHETLEEAMEAAGLKYVPEAQQTGSAP